MTNLPAKHWAIIPAAGIGKRMGADIPKQYMTIEGKSVIQICIENLCHTIRFEKIIVALSDKDNYWRKQSFDKKNIQTVVGGAERADSVMAGLDYLGKFAAAQDWVWVHDAARPCVRQEDLMLLRDKIAQHETGGILGMPVRDTMKQVNNMNITSTLDRNNIWHALTPQVFRFARLQSAMQQARGAGVVITDEASALEHAGYMPLMVEGHPDNIKITHPDDLKLADYYLAHQIKS